MNISKTSLTAALLAAGTMALTAYGDPLTYRLDASVWAGTNIDLTAMSGYYADRMYGPSSANIEFKGTFTCDSSISGTNPFRLIGNGKRITVNAGSTGFEKTSLILSNAEGVTDTSTLRFEQGWYRAQAPNPGSLDIGAYNRFEYGYSAGWGSGDGVVSADTISVHDGGQMYAQNRFVFACNRPGVISVTDGASITADAGIRLGAQNKDSYASNPYFVQFPITAFLGITNATVTAGGTDVENGKVFTIMYDQTQTWNQEVAHVVIGGESGLLRANCISHCGAGDSRISFDGGSYKPTSESASLPLFHVRGYVNWASSKYPEPRMTIEGINGHSIDVENALNRSLAGGSTGGHREINIRGNGGFTKRGAGVLTFNNHNARSTCDYTGPTAVLGGGLLVTDAAFMPGRGALTVAENAFIDLNGLNAEFSGAAGSGLVSNRSETVSTLTLGYGNVDGAFTVEIGERINVVKTGTGTLTVSGVALANTCDLTVEAGTVVFAGDSSSYGTVTVASDATLDASAVEFGCASLVKQPGATVLTKPKATTVIMR
ncbi:MAG: hypothetical protein ILM98_15020 [Kiritimatiellae bacterium]|nr:hypothetical protein [Kiritimatiellia bacterium]